jgi:hypothetical protein
MIDSLIDRMSGAQMMLGLVAIFALSIVWRERKNADRFVHLLIGLVLGCVIGHLGTV